MNKKVRHCNAFLNLPSAHAAKVKHDFLYALLQQLVKSRPRISSLAVIQTVNAQNSNLSGFHARFSSRRAERTAAHGQRQRPHVGAQNSQLHFRPWRAVEQLSRVVQRNVPSRLGIDVIDYISGANSGLIRSRSFYWRNDVKKRSDL